MLSLFPHLTASEFSQACESLTNAFSDNPSQCEWLSVHRSNQNGTTFLRISTVLPSRKDPAVAHGVEDEADEVQEHDDEAMAVPEHMQPLVNYDILLSPSYQVPVLYISISDPEHRFPPTMANLQEHLLEPHSKDQTEHVGPMGGVTITARTPFPLQRTT
jgi:ubiquitin-like-conjugating enzyme ATG10